MDGLEAQILQCLIIDGRMPLRRIAQVVGVSEQTVARRYRSLRESGVLRVSVVPSGFAGLRQAWAVRIRCRPDSATALAGALAERDDAAWIALVSGGSEIICTASGPIGASTDGVLRRLPRTTAVLSFSAQLLLRAFAGAANAWTVFDTPLTAAWAQLPRSASDLSASGLSPSAVPRRDPDDAVRAEDEPLVRALAVDGRASASSLARELGWPVSRVSARLDALIGGALYVLTDYLPDAFGYHASAVVQLTVRPADVSDVCRALAGHRPTGFVAATSGAANVMATVVCRTSDDLFDYVTGQIGALPGVAQCEIVPYLQRVKEASSRVAGDRLIGPKERSPAGHPQR